MNKLSIIASPTLQKATDWFMGLKTSNKIKVGCIGLIATSLILNFFLGYLLWFGLPAIALWHFGPQIVNYIKERI